MSGATKENRTRNKCVGGKNGVKALMGDAKEQAETVWECDKERGNVSRKLTLN